MSNYAAETLCYSYPVTKSLNTYAPQANQYEVYATSYASAGNLTNNLPIAASPVSKVGCLAASWGTDLFERILITHFQPRIRDVGDIMADQTIEFYIWNTHTIDKTCTAITKTGDTGLTLTGPVPTFHNHPFKAVEYDLTISMNGPATINASYAWDYGQTYDIIMGVIGNRVLLLKMLHNWKEPLSLTLKAETVVSSTKKLYEQRKALYSELRREFTTTGTLADPLLRNRLTAIANLYFGWPIFIEAITPELGQGSIEGLMSFNVVEDLDSYWHIHNVGKMIVWNDELGDCEALGIASVESDKINIVYPSLRTWDLDVCTLYPMLRCTISSLNIVHHTDKVYDVKLTLSEFLDEYGR